MRVQGPSPSGRPRAAPIPGKNNGGGGTMSVWGAGSQRKSKLCLTRRGSWGQGAGGSKLRLRGESPPVWPEFQQRPTRRSLPNTEKYARLVATAAYGRSHITTHQGPAMPAATIATIDTIALRL